jgi:hypothetical protein
LECFGCPRRQGGAKGGYSFLLKNRYHLDCGVSGPHRRCLRLV